MNNQHYYNNNQHYNNNNNTDEPIEYQSQPLYQQQQNPGTYFSPSSYQQNSGMNGLTHRNNIQPNEHNIPPNDPYLPPIVPLKSVIQNKVFHDDDDSNQKIKKISKWKLLKQYIVLYCCKNNWSNPKRKKQVQIITGDDEEEEVKKGSDNYLFYLIKEYKMTAFIVLCLLIYVTYFVCFVYNLNPKRSNSIQTKIYEEQTKHAIIINSNEFSFRSYYINEIRDRRVIYDNKEKLEKYLEIHPDACCVSTLEIPEIHDFPFHIVIRNSNYNKLELPFIHLIYPIYNESSVTAENKTIALYKHIIPEAPSHCIRFGYKNAKGIRRGVAPFNPSLRRYVDHTNIINLLFIIMF